MPAEAYPKEAENHRYFNARKSTLNSSDKNYLSR